ncbi:hypothetical protein [Sphingomonas sp. PB4P5]|uniref:hypothetical protein n=1 Tax=Parasphingomonas puruogangriensis TaxID=3096155 RepID=UPI002FCC912A
MPTFADLRDTLVQFLVGAAGGDDDRWREAVGEVEKLSFAFNIKSNWAIHPAGTPSEMATIAKAAEVVRTAHPYVSG